MVEPSMTRHNKEEEQYFEDGEAYIQYTEEEANVIMSEQEAKFRLLDTKERIQLMDHNLRTTRCPFCDTRVYCTEHICTCAHTKMILIEETLEQYLSKKRQVKKQKVQEIIRQNCPLMNEGPYSGANPHPFENNTGEVYDHFWDQYRYLARSIFEPTDRCMMEDATGMKSTLETSGK